MTLIQKKIAAGLLVCVCVVSTGWGKTVGLWKDERSSINEGMLKTLAEAGWQTTILQGKDLSDTAKLTGLDVIFLPGGWNAYSFADFNARRALVKYVAGGKGILAGAFRSGYVRTANRPLFPQVGATYNRVNGAYISAFGESALAKSIDKPFCPGSWDHLVVKVGPLGKVFAVNGTDPVGVYGDVYGGRYLVFGAFLGIDAGTNVMQGTERQILLKSIEWLAAAPKLSDAGKAKQEMQADLDFLRREKIWDWTRNERGPDSGSGIITQVRTRLAIPLESRQFTLEYMMPFLSGEKLDACRAAAGELKKAVGELDGRFEKTSAEMVATIGKMTIEELSDANVLMNTTNGLAEALMPDQKLNELTGRADKALAEFRPLVKAAKAAKLAVERKRDLASVPGLMAQCAASEAAIRQSATLDLGRIGDPKTAPVLIRALKDNDEKVRINALLGLGWMQSKEAVPELIALIGGEDLMLRRRAAQALGQIGDSRAITPLLGIIGDKDCDTAVNAILSLGWLKAKEAVPEMLKIVNGFAPQQAEPRALMLASIRALGHIGDASALPTLEALVAKAKDFPDNRRGNKPVANIYSTAQSLGLQGHAQLAMAEIKAGGRSEIGIRQSDFLASKEIFYRLTGEFNALAGRPRDDGSLWPYLWEAGMTGIHMAWGNQDSDPAHYLKVIAAAGELDLCWIDVLPTDGNPFGAKETYLDQRQLGVEKPGAEVVLLTCQNEPAFQGFWFEETYPGVKSTSSEFKAWLVAKHGQEFLAALAKSDTGDLAVLNSQYKDFPSFSGFLKSEYLLFQADKMLAAWRESQEWMHGMRKGCAFTFSISHRSIAAYPGVTAQAGSVIDVNGPENYQSFGRDNAFLMEMHKDGEQRPVMCEFYNWYTPSPAHEIRGFAQHLMHGECFYNFALEHIFKYPREYNWTWDASRWDNIRTIFQKARKIKEYIAVPASAANVALVCSDMTFCQFGKVSPLGTRWYQNQAALWTALAQSQIPADVIWAESLTAEKLARYRVLVLSEARMLSKAQEGLLRHWVKQGGTLIATGASSLYDEATAPQADYALADVFGVAFAGSSKMPGPDKVDTFSFIPGKPPIPVQSGLTRESVRDYVHRDVKPVKALATYKVADKAEVYLPGMAAGIACEYDLPLGYDLVKNGSAVTLAAFANGDAALTVNTVGRGLCYFWTPLSPGLCHVTSGWEMDSNGKAFWPNVRELFAAMVKGGLVQQKTCLPVEVTGVSLDVEVTVRQQMEQNRWMVHLLDYDPKSVSVKGAVLTVHPPTGKTVNRIFYPDTDTELKYSVTENGVKSQLRDFAVHDMVVVEYIVPQKL